MAHTDTQTHYGDAVGTTDQPAKPVSQVKSSFQDLTDAIDRSSQGLAALAAESDTTVESATSPATAPPANPEGQVPADWGFQPQKTSLTKETRIGVVLVVLLLVAFAAAIVLKFNQGPSGEAKAQTENQTEPTPEGNPSGEVTPPPILSEQSEPSPLLPQAEPTPVPLNEGEPTLALQGAPFEQPKPVEAKPEKTPKPEPTPETETLFPEPVQQTGPAPEVEELGNPFAEPEGSGQTEPVPELEDLGNPFGDMNTEPAPEVEEQGNPFGDPLPTTEEKTNPQPEAIPVLETETPIVVSPKDDGEPKAFERKEEPTADNELLELPFETPEPVEQTEPPVVEVEGGNPFSEPTETPTPMNVAEEPLELPLETPTETPSPMVTDPPAELEPFPAPVEQEEPKTVEAPELGEFAPVEVGREEAGSNTQVQPAQEQPEVIAPVGTPATTVSQTQEIPTNSDAQNPLETNPFSEPVPFPEETPEPIEEPKPIEEPVLFPTENSTPVEPEPVPNKQEQFPPLEQFPAIEQPKQNQNPPALNSNPQNHTTQAPSAYYVVQPGDNYWKISKKQYGTTQYFMALHLYNQKRIPDPRKMRPGMKVLTPKASVFHQQFPQLFRNQPAPQENTNTANKPAEYGFFIDRNGKPAYKIGPDDTLTGIAHKHLGRASRWVQIYELNRSTLQNPDKLQLGKVIQLPADASRVARGTNGSRYR